MRALVMPDAVMSPLFSERDRAVKEAKRARGAEARRPSCKMVSRAAVGATW